MVKLIKESKIKTLDNEIKVFTIKVFRSSVGRTQYRVSENGVLLNTFTDLASAVVYFDTCIDELS